MSGAPKNVQQREPLHPAGWESTAPHIRERFLAIARSCAGLHQLSAGEVMGAPSSFFSPLKHELSRHFMANSRRRPRIRSNSEREIFAGLSWSEFDQALRSTEGFQRFLIRVAREVAGKEVEFRHTQVGLAPDKGGTLVVFPPAAQIPIQIELLRQRILEHAPANRGVCAPLALAMITNAHPFQDGNGRIARIIFNLCLQSSPSQTQSYIPLFELFYQSEGGYEIALRQVELQGRWDNFIHFLSDVLQVHCSISSSPAKDNSFRRGLSIKARPYFEMALKESFPPFVTCIAGSSTVNSTPYVTDLFNLESAWSRNSQKRNLLVELDRRIKESASYGVEVDIVMLGGSALDENCALPRDLDGVAFYRAASATDIGAAVTLLQQRFREFPLDLRLVPSDGDPFILIKAVSYFTTLYLQSREGSAAQRGLILVDCRR